MSIQKQRKVAQLGKKPAISRFFNGVVINILIIFFTFIICWTGIMGTVESKYITMNEECLDVVRIINESWNGEDKAVIRTQLNEDIRSCSTVSSIFIVDDELNVLASYGFDEFNPELVPPEHYITFKKEQGTLLRSTIGIEGDKPSISIRNIFRTLKNLLFYWDFTSDMTSMAHSGRTAFKGYQWVLYPTRKGNVNACIKQEITLTEQEWTTIVGLLLLFVSSIFICSVIELTRHFSSALQDRRIERILNTDPITGGSSREYFLAMAGQNSRRKALPVLVHLKVNKYRNYCLAYGVEAGEAFLERINTVLEDMLDHKELVAHTNQSDFLLLLFGQEESQVATRVNTMIAVLTELAKGEHVVFNAGLCVMSHKEDIIRQLTSAELALSRAIDSNTQLLWFNDAMREQEIWEHQVEEEMATALRQRQFQVYLQPKYSAKEETLSAAEALIRWKHPEHGLVPPGKFIPLFEKNGFILKIDDFMLREIARLQSRWISEGKQPVPISVNISRAHFTQEKLAEHICTIVDTYQVPHEYIELELTESAFFDDKAVILNTVRKLKEFGFKISMDDFGTGFSSLNSLKELPLDIIKLDAEFFRGVEDKNRADTIVGDTIKMAKKLGMDIVAEGIETREQLDFLASQDCDLIQGYLFSKPLPVTEFEERAWPDR